jgi:hypothetical protein
VYTALKNSGASISLFEFLENARGCGCFSFTASKAVLAWWFLSVVGVTALKNSGASVSLYEFLRKRSRLRVFFINFFVNKTP